MNRHGTRARYIAGCKCAPCKAANTRYAKLAKYRSDQGISTLLDAAPVKRHLRRLRAAGVGKRTIAARAGVSQTVVDRLLGLNSDRPAKRVRPDIAAKILAVTVNDRADGSLIDGTGTRRRLQALVALGYTQTDLAQRIGWSVANLNVITLGRHPSVTCATANLVDDLYEELSMRPGPSMRARAVARRNGWVPPLAWHDIDDLLEQPEPGALRRNDHINPLDVLELHEAGETPDAIAQRLGLSIRSIPTYLGRARQVAS